MISSGNVTIDKCFIYGFTTGYLTGGIGVYVTSAAGSVDIRDTDITNSTTGVLVQPAAGYPRLRLSFDNVRINDVPAYGIAVNTAAISIRNSFIIRAGTAAISTSGSAFVTLDHSELANSGTAINAGDTSTIVINDNSIYLNQTGLAISSGSTIATANNNKAYSNGTNATPNGNVSTF